MYVLSVLQGPVELTIFKGLPNQKIEKTVASQYKRNTVYDCSVVTEISIQSLLVYTNLTNFMLESFGGIYFFR